ncbi:18990_t:CDS:2 [Rhizophagus irregularis]|nr:18990_t:CDS:2 [Rhizophagus irregularis]
MQRKLEQCALKILLEPLLQNDSIYLAINGTVEHFTPYLSTILADMLEAQNICCTYKSYRAKYPCYKCLTPGDQLNNMHIEQNSIILRTHENMREAQCGNKILTKMDNRLANITPFNGLKILSKGYQRGVKFTGAEMRDVMKIIIFVIDELYTVDDKNAASISFIPYMTLIDCYIKFVKMYITSRKEQFSDEDDLRIFEIRRQTIISIPKKIFKSKLEIMKSLLWELPISELQSLQIKLEHEKIVDDLCIEGMNHLINCLDHYLDEKSNVSESEDIYLKIYATGILSNNEIIYATSKFHGHARFSDVAIAMEDADYLTDDGICYGKVLMLAEISFLPNHPILPIVLVHWYDYYSKRHPINLATCESLTGGLFASTLTHIPGASQILKGGLIVYCNEAKKIIAKVSPITLEKYGAVSEQCAREMAQNTQQLLKVDLAISFTGNAGPQALENKPVGLVYISLAIQERLINKSYQFFGSREEIKEQTVEAGIELIEKVLNEKYEKFTIW